MRRAPDDLVRHAGYNVAVMLHVERRAEANGYDKDVQAHEPREKDAVVRAPIIFDLCHTHLRPGIPYAL